jgi:hypothetical protein
MDVSEVCPAAVEDLICKSEDSMHVPPYGIHSPDVVGESLKDMPDGPIKHHEMQRCQPQRKGRFHK